MVLEENDRLSVEFARQIHRFLAVDEVLPFRLGSAGVGVLEEAHLELGLEDALHGCVDGFDVQLAGFDEFRDCAEVAKNGSVWA